MLPRLEKAQLGANISLVLTVTLVLIFYTSNPEVSLAPKSAGLVTAAVLLALPLFFSSRFWTKYNRRKWLTASIGMTVYGLGILAIGIAAYFKTLDPTYFVDPYDPVPLLLVYPLPTLTAGVYALLATARTPDVIGNTSDTEEDSTSPLHE